MKNDTLPIYLDHADIAILAEQIGCAALRACDEDGRKVWVSLNLQLMMVATVAAIETITGQKVVVRAAQ